MAERVDCDACRTHSRPCDSPSSCPCWCTPRKGRKCPASTPSGGLCDCYRSPKATGYTLGGAA